MYILSSSLDNGYDNDTAWPINQIGVVWVGPLIFSIYKFLITHYFSSG